MVSSKMRSHVKSKLRVKILELLMLMFMFNWKESGNVVQNWHIKMNRKTDTGASGPYNNISTLLEWNNQWNVQVNLTQY